MLVINLRPATPLEWTLIKQRERLRRAVRWIKDLIDELVHANNLKWGTGGNLQYDDTTGNLLYGCEEEDDPAFNDCPYCDTFTPHFAMVTLAGVSLCSPHTGTIDGDYCLEGDGECEWETTRDYNCCTNSVGCISIELLLVDDGLGGGEALIGVAVPTAAQLFVGSTSGVSACSSSIPINNDYTALDCGTGPLGYGGTATVDWGNCDPGCPAGFTPDSQCGCRPDTLTLIVSGVGLDTLSCNIPGPMDCFLCESGPETISTTISCSYDLGSNRWIGTEFITSDCGDPPPQTADKIDRLFAIVDRMGQCQWAVLLIGTNAASSLLVTVFCGESDPDQDCESSVVIDNMSNGMCQGCDDPSTIPSGCFLTEGMAAGSGGTVTVNP